MPGVGCQILVHLKCAFGAAHGKAKPAVVLPSLEHGPTAFYSVDTVTVSMPQEGLWDVAVTALFDFNGLVVHTEAPVTFDAEIHPALVQSRCSPMTRNWRSAGLGLSVIVCVE
jgi:hypothetical protein